MGRVYVWFWTCVKDEQSFWPILWHPLWLIIFHYCWCPIFGFWPFLFYIDRLNCIKVFLGVSRRKLDVADVFLLLTYAMTLINGVFVLGRGYGMQWVETFFIYLVLKIAQAFRFKTVKWCLDYSIFFLGLFITYKKLVFFI